jgi:bifunctional DNase/RNase
MGVPQRCASICALTGVLLYCVTFSLVGAQSRAAERAGDRIRIQEVDVGVSPVGPVVLLKAEAKAIPVFVDQTVAASIRAALTRQKLARPLSHDLMRTILAAYGGKVVQVVVTLRGTTYYGALTIDVAGERKVFDSRSSDAIALAVHFSAPIWVSRELLDKAGQAVPDPPGSRRL